MKTPEVEADVWQVSSGADLGRALSEIRAQVGLTQQQLADMLGVSRTYVVGLESESTVQQTDRMLRALRRLGAEVTITFGRPTR